MPHVSDVLSSRDIAKFSNLQVLARGVVEGFCSGLLVPMTTDQPYADSLAAYLALRRKGTVMTFLNGALAFGTLAFLIPLIIHILNRSRFRTVEWGAMHLLESVIKVNHKRFRIDQLILLLVRCAIPVLLALCLAKPVLTNSNSRWLVMYGKRHGF